MVWGCLVALVAVIWCLLHCSPVDVALNSEEEAFKILWSNLTLSSLDVISESTFSFLWGGTGKKRRQKQGESPDVWVEWCCVWVFPWRTGLNNGKCLGLIPKWFSFLLSELQRGNIFLAFHNKDNTVSRGKICENVGPKTMASVVSYSL